MFESILAKIANTIRTVVRTMGVATRKTPWLPVAIIALFMVV